jgi:hypothetical protein
MGISGFGVSRRMILNWKNARALVHWVVAYAGVGVVVVTGGVALALDDAAG